MCDIPKEVVEVIEEYKGKFNLIIGELREIFTEDFNYRNVLKPINGREQPEEPSKVIDNLQLCEV